jgi:hypothetical protein
VIGELSKSLVDFKHSGLNLGVCRAAVSTARQMESLAAFPAIKTGIE